MVDNFQNGNKNKTFAFNKSNSQKKKINAQVVPKENGLPSPLGCCSFFPPISPSCNCPPGPQGPKGNIGPTGATGAIGPAGQRGPLVQSGLNNGGCWWTIPIRVHL